MATTITAHVVNGGKYAPCVELRENDVTILKAYPSPDGTKLRIVLPEFVDARQAQGNIEGLARYVEFTRKPPAP